MGLILAGAIIALIGAFSSRIIVAIGVIVALIGLFQLVA